MIQRCGADSSNKSVTWKRWNWFKPPWGLILRKDNQIKGTFKSLAVIGENRNNQLAFAFSLLNCIHFETSAIRDQLSLQLFSETHSWSQNVSALLAWNRTQYFGNQILSLKHDKMNYSNAIGRLGRLNLLVCSFNFCSCFPNDRFVTIKSFFFLWCVELGF